MNTDYFDNMPQKFYLLSVKCRRLFTYESTDRSLEMAVEEAFEKLPRLEGGNVYPVFEESLSDWYQGDCVSGSLYGYCTGIGFDGWR